MKKSIAFICAGIIVLTVSSCTVVNHYKDKFDRCIYNEKCVEYESFDFDDTRTDFEKYLDENIENDLDGIRLEYISETNSNMITITIEEEDEFSSESYLYYEELHKQISFLSSNYYYDLYLIQIEFNVLYDQTSVHYSWTNSLAEITFEYSEDILATISLYGQDTISIAQNATSNIIYIIIEDSEGVEETLVKYSMDSRQCKVKSINVESIADVEIQDVKNTINEIYSDFTIDYSLE